MKKNIIFVLSLLIFPFVLSGCGYTTSVPVNTTPATQQSTVTGSAQTPTVVNQEAKIDIQNFSFNPSVLTIKQGTTVTWTNNDSVPHQLKSDTFNSNALTNGQSFSFTFKKFGTFSYICSIHPSMSGTVVVQ